MKNFKTCSRGFFIHASLITVSLLSIFPFLWLLSTALKGADENIFQYPPVFFPESPTLANFKGVWNQIPFMLYFLNSMIVAGFTVILNLILSSLAAYPLARMEFKGKKTIFYATLATIMIPFQAIMLPVYLIVLKLNMVDSVNSVMGYIGLILPFAIGGETITICAHPAIFAGIESIKTVDGYAAVPPGTYKPTFSMGRTF